MVRTTLQRWRVIELFHYRGPYHLGNNSLICFYMIGTSDMKELIWNCHTHTYGCKWGSNHNHDRQLITGSLLQPVDYTDYYLYIPSFSKYAGLYWPNKLLFLFSRIFFVVFRFPSFSFQKDQAVYWQLPKTQLSKNETEVYNYCWLLQIQEYIKLS